MFLGMSVHTCTKKTAAWVIMGYHIIACLNQVGSIINYFSWRRFQRRFLMWQAIELVSILSLKPESTTKRVVEKLVNDKDVFVNQLNLDCIISHSSQIKILLYH